MKKFNPLQLFLGCMIILAGYSCAPKYGAHFSSSATFYQPEIQQPVSAPGPPVEASEHANLAPATESVAADQLVVSKGKIIAVKPME